MPRPRSDSSKAKPRPSSATSSSTPPSSRRAQRHLDPAGAAVAGGVGERLLGDPVDDQLGVVAEVGEVALGAELGLDLTARELLDLARDRRRQAEVVERGRAQLAGEREQLAHRLVGERFGLGELGLELRRRRLAGRLEAQQQPGQRLVDLVVEVAGDPRPLLLLGAAGPPSRRAAARLPAGASSAGRRARSAPPPRSRRRRRSRRAAAARAGSGRPSPSPRSGARAARSGAAAAPG